MGMERSLGEESSQKVADQNTITAISSGIKFLVPIKRHYYYRSENLHVTEY